MAGLVDNPTTDEFERLLAEHAFVAVDFYATWCGPCKAYSPKFHRLAREIRREKPDASVAFVSVDVDRNHELARTHRVQSVPTTIVLRRKKGFFGGWKRVEALRFSGDRAWPELLRDFTRALSP